MKNLTRNEKMLGGGVLAVMLVGAAIYLFLARQSSPNFPSLGGNTKTVATPAVSPTPEAPLAPAAKTTETVALTDWADDFVNEEVKKITRPPDLGELVSAWDKDAQYEADLVSKETFAETLENTADYNQNYFRLILGSQTYHASRGTTLQVIVRSRRFSKLVEDLGSDNRASYTAALFARLKRDLTKFRRMKKEDPKAKSFTFGCTLHNPNFKDQSDLVSALCYRLNVSEVLIGQFELLDGLPLVLESFDTRNGTFMVNHTSVAYACDKIISADRGDSLSAAQRQVRDEYLAWKAALPDRSREGKFFKYKSITIPSYRSPRRPFERSTAMGARVSDPEIYGTVTIEIPPAITAEGIEGAKHPRGPQKEVIAFARRFLKAAGAQAK